MGLAPMREFEAFPIVSLQFSTAAAGAMIAAEVSAAVLAAGATATVAMAAGAAAVAVTQATVDASTDGVKGVLDERYDGYEVGDVSKEVAAKIEGIMQRALGDSHYHLNEATSKSLTAGFLGMLGEGARAAEASSPESAAVEPSALQGWRPPVGVPPPGARWDGQRWV